jgi:hypothetical protein
VGELGGDHDVVIEERGSCMDVAMLGAVPIVDSHAHVSEPPDLWLSRLPSKWRDVAPQVRHNEATAMSRWCVGDQWRRRRWPSGASA